MIFNKINNFFDRKNEEEYLEEYLPNYKKVRSLTGLLIVVSFFSILVTTLTLHFSNQDKKVQAILYNEELNKTKEVDLFEKPSFSQEKLENYVENILINLFDLNFVNAETKFNSYEKYFTNFAWEKFKFTAKQDFVDYIIQKSLTSKLTVVTKPLLVRSGRMLDGTQRWQFALKVYVSYSGSIRNPLHSYNNVVLTLRTSDLSKNPNGLLIEELTMIRTKE